MRQPISFWQDFKAGLQLVWTGLPVGRRSAFTQSRRYLKESAVQFKNAVGWMAYLLVHLVILLTLPISLPLLAFIAIHVRKKEEARFEAFRTKSIRARDSGNAVWATDTPKREFRKS